MSIGIWDWARLSVSAVILFVLAVTSTGCELIVEDGGSRPEPQRTALSTGVTALPSYDVAVSAIDFDPPLNAEALLASRKPIKLLAAVENSGTMQLRDLTVDAKIITQRGDVTAQTRRVLDKLAPGETKVVEFEGMASTDALPKSSYYRIRVSVEGQRPGSEGPSNSRELLVRVIPES